MDIAKDIRRTSMRCQVTYPNMTLVHEYATFEEAVIALGEIQALITILTTEPETFISPLVVPATVTIHAPEGLHFHAGTLTLTGDITGPRIHVPEGANCGAPASILFTPDAIDRAAYQRLRCGAWEPSLDEDIPFPPQGETS
jgi:hypothetical protein